MALDVDGKEIDGSSGVALAELGKGEGGDGARRRGMPRLPVAGGVGLRQRRPAREVGRELVEGQFTLGVGDGHVEVDVPLPLGRQEGEGMRRRLDVDAVPAEFVEMLGDGVPHRLVGADVDVEAGLAPWKGAVQQHVLVVLGIADHGHRAPAFSRSSDHAAALRTPSWGSSRSLARASTTWGWARNGSSNLASAPAM